MATRNVSAFEQADFVVADAAGCSAHLKDYPHWVPAHHLVGWEVRDINELVAEAIDKGFLPRLSTDRGTVALQHPCHLNHAQSVSAEPRDILKAAGYEPRDIDPMCCGAAGFYSLLHPEISQELGENKVEEVHRTGSQLVASANPGCEMQLRSHLGEGYRVLHPVELYRQALSEESNVTR